MPNAQLRGILDYLQRIVPPADQPAADDSELLRRFATHGDQSAFELLVWRHGRMVLGVCRRVLRDEQEAEDAFQATFLVLARRARTIGRRGSVGAWLYRVAYRAALAARARRGRRAELSPAIADRLTDLHAVDPADAAAWREVALVIDGLVNGLPEKYRAPFVLCCFEGKSNREAARELGCPVGTLESWLTRARARLRAGLSRRRLTLPAALTAASAGNAAFSATWLVTATVNAAGLFAAGESPVDRAGGPVALAEGLLRGTLTTKLKAGAALLLLACALAVGAAVAEPERAKSAAPPATPEEVAHKAVVTGQVTDQAGRPMPGARVWLRDGRLPPFRFRTTDADTQGRFRFGDVERGSVNVAAIVPDHSFAATAVGTSFQLGRPALDLTLVVTAAQDLRVQVRDADDKPVQGAKLTSLSWKTDRTEWCWFPLDVLPQEKMSIPVSDKDGRLTISGVPFGTRVRLFFDHPDFARQEFVSKGTPEKAFTVRMERGWPLTVFAVEADSGKPAKRATVTVTGIPHGYDVYDQPVDDDSKCTVRMGKAVEVTINVYHPELMARTWERIHKWEDMGDGQTYHFKLYRKGKVRGRVVDDKTNKRLPEVRVLMDGGSRKTIASGVTDESGRYELEGPAGSVTLDVQAGAGYLPVEHGAVTLQLGPAMPAEAANLVAQKLPMVHGNVYLPDGKPAVGVLVVDDGLGGYRTRFTDAAGRFEFRLQQDRGSPFVTASHPTENLSGAATLTVAELEQGAECSIHLEPESELQGTLLDPEGKPLVRTKVRLGLQQASGNSTMYSRSESCLTDAAGQFRFRGLNRAWKYRAAVYGPTVDRPLAASSWIEPREKTITLDPITVPAGTLEPPDEAPLVAAELHCQAWINSAPLKLASLRGKVVLLEFFAAWNGPRLDELALVQRTHELFADKGLVVIGIHASPATVDQVSALVRERKLTFPVGLDEAKGTTCADHGMHGFVYGMLIGRDGKILHTGLHGNMLPAVRRALLYDVKTY
jgi:RNA polymerase sigma factor (sigma-70 family)